MLGFGEGEGEPGALDRLSDAACAFARIPDTRAKSNPRKCRFDVVECQAYALRQLGIRFGLRHCRTGDPERESSAAPNRPGVDPVGAQGGRK